jgi:hypothetical protein
MWPPAHAFGELALMLGVGATGAGIVRIVWVEGRIALIVGVMLLLCSVLLGGFFS